MGTNLNDLIKMVTIDVEHETRDPFGQVRGGRLQIEGPLIKTTLRCCIPNDRMEYRNKHWLGDSLAIIMPDLEDFEDGSEVRCLPIHWIPNGYPAVYGLLVEPTHRMKGEYRRIGRFAVAPFNVEAQSVDNFLARRRFRLPGLEWEECLGQDNEDKAYQYRFSLA